LTRALDGRAPSQADLGDASIWAVPRRASSSRSRLATFSRPQMSQTALTKFGRLSSPLSCSRHRSSISTHWSSVSIRLSSASVCNRDTRRRLGELPERSRGATVRWGDSAAAARLHGAGLKDAGLKGARYVRSLGGATARRGPWLSGDGLIAHGSSAPAVPTRLNGAGLKGARYERSLGGALIRHPMWFRGDGLIAHCASAEVAARVSFSFASAIERSRVDACCEACTKW